MSNQGWTNGSGGGTQVSSTARTTGRGTETGAFDDFVTGARDCDHGGDNDPLGQKSDQFAVNGVLSTTKPI